MRKYLLAFFAVFFLLSTSAWAQRAGAAVNVPFPFVVNGTEFPAGNYEISKLGPKIENVMSIENVQTREKALVPFRQVGLLPGKVQQSTRLIFTKEANQYVLHQIRIEGDFHTHDVIHMDIMEASMKPED